MLTLNNSGKRREKSTQNENKSGTEWMRKLSKSDVKKNSYGNDMEVTSLQYYTLTNGRICITPTTKSKMEQVIHEIMK